MKAIVMVGMPGCGKSTAGAALEGYEEINRDNLRLELTGAYDDFTREPRITRMHEDRIRQAAQQGKDVVVSDTNTIRRYRRKLIALLKQLGYRVEVHLFDVSLETCLARNKTRSKPVDEDVIREMARRMRLNPPGLDEGMDEIRIIQQAEASSPPEA